MLKPGDPYQMAFLWEIPSQGKTLGCLQSILWDYLHVFHKSQKTLPFLSQLMGLRHIYGWTELEASEPQFLHLQTGEDPAGLPCRVKHSCSGLLPPGTAKGSVTWSRGGGAYPLLPGQVL